MGLHGAADPMLQRPLRESWMAGSLALLLWRQTPGCKVMRTISSCLVLREQIIKADSERVSG